MSPYEAFERQRISKRNTFSQQLREAESTLYNTITKNFEGRVFELLNAFELEFDQIEKEEEERRQHIDATSAQIAHTAGLMRGKAEFVRSELEGARKNLEVIEAAKNFGSTLAHPENAIFGPGVIDSITTELAHVSNQIAVLSSTIARYESIFGLRVERESERSMKVHLPILENAFVELAVIGGRIVLAQSNPFLADSHMLIEDLNANQRLDLFFLKLLMQLAPTLFDKIEP